MEVIFERLQKGEEVSLRDFKNAIPSEEYESYKQALEIKKMELSGGFGYCAEYEKWLKKGIFEYNRAEGFSGNNRKNYHKFHTKAQVYFENAIEALKEEHEQNPSIEFAYDRGVKLWAGHNDVGGLDPGSMPRLKSSKSYDNLLKNSRKLDKRSAKIKAVKQALKVLISEEQDELVKADETSENTQGKEVQLNRYLLDGQGEKVRTMLRKLKEQLEKGEK